ncbi:hypothetical protein L6164_009554 [Bauhinia variegata]|uniref:Uncharacterized protein n=1 Tax=Bauhinia variegata TaxID=167791 RepID=A0ACB9PK81_BAUVA|nr:hypothetical protein L6164_009554 [Bauhinia variegata]
MRIVVYQVQENAGNCLNSNHWKKICVRQSFFVSSKSIISDVSSRDVNLQCSIATSLEASGDCDVFEEMMYYHLMSYNHDNQGYETDPFFTSEELIYVTVFSTSGKAVKRGHG